jgi:hypothetical protein
MNRTPVNSSNLSSVGYDPATRTLEIAFRSGSVYQYFDVPQTIYEALIAASSHGTYFHYTIRDVYRYRRVQ